MPPDRSQEGDAQVISSLLANRSAEGQRESGTSSQDRARIRRLRTAPGSAGGGRAAKPARDRDELIERARWIKAITLACVFHPSFDEPSARKRMLNGDPSVAGHRDSGPQPSGVSAYVASLYRTPLLEREEETELFHRMNGLKYLAAAVQQRIDADTPNRRDVDEFERLMERAIKSRNRILEANLRLVFSLAKRFAGANQDEFGECVAEGNIALMRAVEHYDFSRGNRFSTYAHHAIRRQLLQRVRGEVRRRERFLPGGDDAAANMDRDEGDSLRLVQRSSLAARAVEDLLPCLSDRERAVIEVRFGLGQRSEQTFEEIGRSMGVSKERVRQLQVRALHKLAQSARDKNTVVAWEDA